MVQGDRADAATRGDAELHAVGLRIVTAVLDLTRSASVRLLQEDPGGTITEIARAEAQVVPAYPLARDAAPSAAVEVELGRSGAGLPAADLPRHRLLLCPGAGHRFDHDVAAELSWLKVHAGDALADAGRRADVELRRRWAEASAEVGHGLARAAVGGGDVLALVVETVRTVAAADRVVIYRSAPGDTVEVRAARGPKAPGVGSRITVAGSAVEPALRSRRSSRRGPGRRTGVELVCPLLDGTDVCGALLLGRPRSGPPFDATELELAGSFAAHAAVALELADARASLERLVVLQDRHRIARDLHDHVIQRLFATGLQLQSLVALAPVDSPHSERVARAVDDIDETIRQIRTSIFELTDDRVGPTPRRTLLSVVDSVEPALGFRPAVELRGAVDLLLDPEPLADVVAVVREALSNVARHAAAGWARVRVEVDDDQVLVEVSDDGGAGRSKRRGRGLANLDARAGQRHGTMSVEHGDEGTRLRWTARLR